MAALALTLTLIAAGLATPASAAVPEELISVATTGGPGNDGSDDPKLSSDGRIVWFESYATNLVSATPQSSKAVFVRDLQAKTTTRVAVEGQPASELLAVSANGRFGVVANSNRSGVYKYDRSNGAALRLSVNVPEMNAQDTVISDDGNTIFANEALIRSGQTPTSLLCPSGAPVPWNSIYQAAMDAGGSRLLFTTDRCGSSKVSAYRMDLTAGTTQALYTGSGCEGWGGNVCVGGVMLSRDGQHYALSIPGNATAGVPDYIIVDGLRTQLNTTSVPYGGAICGLSDDGKYVVMSLANKLTVWRIGVANLSAVRSENAGTELCRRGGVSRVGAIAYLLDGQVFLNSSLVSTPTQPPSPAASLETVATAASVGETTSFTYTCAGGGTIEVLTEDNAHAQAQLGLAVTGNNLDYSSTVTWDLPGIYTLWLTCGSVRVASPPIIVSGENYVALGDSYSSGEGNSPFLAERGSCNVSFQSAWPMLLAEAMSTKLSLRANVACSGATTSALSQSFKGQAPQLTSLSNTPADIVTVTMGGNDIGFPNLVKDCYLFNCAADGLAQRTTAVVANLESYLPAMYRQIRDAAGPGTRLIVVGYPAIVPSPTATLYRCAWLSASERRQLAILTDRLDQGLTKAAATAGVEYVSTKTLLRGRELCTRNSWMKPVVNDWTYTGSAHLNLAGQQAIATAVRRYLETN